MTGSAIVVVAVIGVIPVVDVDGVVVVVSGVAVGGTVVGVALVVVLSTPEVVFKVGATVVAFNVVFNTVKKQV